MSPSLPPHRIGFQDILVNHLARYPHLQLEDVYKLAHQACLGSEHAVVDPAHARRWLERELAQLSDGPKDPMFDPISADGRILRVHLRPYLAGGGDPDALLGAFVRTANDYRGCTTQLESYGDDVQNMAESGRLPFSPAEARALWREMEASKYPAVHHSAIYETRYRPAYRVVARDFLPGSVRVVLE